MKGINWNAEKSQFLKQSRGICLEDIVVHVERGDVLDDYFNPNQQRYSGQRIMVIGAVDCAYLIPYVETEDELFLKTIIPSRKLTKGISEKNMKTRLSKEEKEILESFEKGEWTPVENLSERKKALAECARNTLKKDKRLNIRISERDLVELQRKAVQEGLPYQTYVSSIIHKFVNGNMPLIGFGTFSVAERKARKGRNPQTGKEIKIAANKVPKFSAGAGIRAAAAGKAAPAKPKAQKAAAKPKKK